MNSLKINKNFYIKFKQHFYRSKFESLSTTTASNNKIVNLAHDVFDKYNSDKSLIIAHGLFASKFSWRSVAKAINEKTRFKVYTVDLRNHADSLPYTESMTYIDMAHDLNYFIQNTVLKNQVNKNVAIMGHSMGGKASMTLSLLYPNSINKLIVADVSPNTSPSFDSIKSYLEKMKTINFSNSKTIYEARNLAEKALLELPSLQRDGPMRAFILTRLTERDGTFTWNFDINSIYNNIENIMHFPQINQKYNNLALFLGGETSNYITEKDKNDIDRYFPNNKIIKIPNAGHVIHLDNPQETIKAIDQYLNS